MGDISTIEDYIECVSNDADATEACSDILDRFANKAHDTAGAMEIEPAACAIAKIIVSYDIDDRTRVLKRVYAKATTDTAKKSGFPGDDIESEIKRQVSNEMLGEPAENNGLSLSYDKYALDRYLEKNLVKVKKLVNTDQHADPSYSWVFDDDTVVETSKRAPVERYNFFIELRGATEKELSNQLVSEEIGNFNDNPEVYRKNSLGPECRAWHDSEWEDCMTSLINERCETVEIDGPRTMMLEWLADDIARSRVTTDVDDAVAAGRMAARIDQSGGDGVDEILVPSRDIERELDDRGVGVTGLQQEVVARSMDSSRLPGETVTEVIEGEGRQLRYWVFDADHELVPEPEELTDSLDMAAGGREWGDVDA